MREFRLVYAADDSARDFSERLAARFAAAHGGVTITAGVGYYPPFESESVLIFDCGTAGTAAETFDFANMAAREICRALNQESAYFRNIDGAAYILDGATPNPYHAETERAPAAKAETARAEISGTLGGYSFRVPIGGGYSESERARLAETLRDVLRQPKPRPVSAPLAALRNHVSGAIARGEKAAIVERPARKKSDFNADGTPKAAETLETRAAELRRIAQTMADADARRGGDVRTAAEIVAAAIKAE